MPPTLRSIAVALLLGLAVAAPAGAATPAEELKSQIDDVLRRLEKMSNGIVKWQGADRMDIRPASEGAVADIANARISIGSPDDKPCAERVRVNFDHIELHRIPAPPGAAKLEVVLPTDSTVLAIDGNDVHLTLKAATGSALLDAKSGRARESA